MHSCPPPSKAINNWLRQYPSEEGNYGHLLLEQKQDIDAKLVGDLVPYFESAHTDAREYFCAQIGIDLHPDADENDEAAYLYPGCLPKSAIHGLFGGVMAGMLTEHYKYIGDHNWSVPVFLFRYHDDAEKYLFDLSRNAARTRQVFGRFGSDFLGLCIDDGYVTRFIVGEAKWRGKLNQSTIDKLMLGDWEVDENTGAKVRSGKGVWFEMNRDTPAPHGLRQLQQILKEREPQIYSNAIASLDRVLMLRNPESLSRTNLVLIAGNDVPTREEAHSLIPWDVKPPEYAVPHDLQVVELVLNNGESLIREIYDLLWE